MPLLHKKKRTGHFSKACHLCGLPGRRTRADVDFKEKSARLLQWEVFSHVWSTFCSLVQLELRIFKTYCKRQNLVQNEPDVQNLEKKLEFPALAILFVCNSDFFRTYETFYEKFLIAFQIAPFYIFWHYETVQNSHFCLVLGTKYPPIIFSILSEFGGSKILW